MAIIKTIEIDGRPVPFRASAAIPRLYRLRFQRDIFQDLEGLVKDVEGGDPENSALDLMSLSIFENIAYLMAKYADPAVPDTPEEWLDGFGTFSIYEVLPGIAELWGLNMNAIAESKKKPGPPTGR